ncbi:MAG: RluA family pseudouridine synthase [Candidatus Parcubacteria bacterium]|nr:RluA family pseudouridine synthase [Candidatus Parcubacteria bacterium]
MAKEIKILYEDANILVIDKPSGISVHGDGRSKEKTLVDWILKNYPKMKNVGEPMGEIVRPGIVHRLDKETSGVLILAKNQKAHEFLKEQFQNRTIKKVYNAIVSGHFKNERGVINKPIGRSPVDFRRHLAGRGARGELREAITEYKVLKNLGEFTYIEVKPKTGRTHQIRVHMKYLNHPVVCDSLYNPSGPCPKELKRLGLHALSVEFKDLKGKTVKVESPLPLQFKKLIR